MRFLLTNRQIKQELDAKDQEIARLKQDIVVLDLIIDNLKRDRVDLMAMNKELNGWAWDTIRQLNSQLNRRPLEPKFVSVIISKESKIRLDFETINNAINRGIRVINRNQIISDYDYIKLSYSQAGWIVVDLGNGFELKESQ